MRVSNGNGVTYLTRRQINMLRCGKTVPVKRKNFTVKLRLNPDDGKAHRLRLKIKALNAKLMTLRGAK